ncbi:N-acetylmuramoyl-L-alanine amidase [Kiloniella sp. b19]|uniref:N-acetylmuramoyl-L-alanine amidase n=1 Tax=Kiloniella sp. GXU_MW_B19 TaxID=3141326 RepID=UPI0031DA4616
MLPHLASPNHGPRPEDCLIDMLILHYTGMQSAEEALERLCDPDAQVSAHYLVCEDGQILQLVPDDRRAWHAGVAAWDGQNDINSCSIGVEIVNPGHEWGYRPFTTIQMQAVEVLCRSILSRHPIPPHRVLGHSDVAPKRKQDPGELFDWARLASAGIGLWPSEQHRTGAPLVATDGDIRQAFGEIGYSLQPEQDLVSDGNSAVITAFQRHFQPHSLTGQTDRQTLDTLWAVRRCFAESRAQHEE